ncbi:MAG: LamG domain-containing protein, partial [Roseibacillus sp.]|nr:LamG domain-containing protein [Roseibacillus sp.]
QAHITAGSASTTADNLEFIAPHPGTYDTGLFGGAGYFGPGQGGGHAEAPFSPDIDGDSAGATQEITVQWWGRVDAFTTSWQAGVARGEGANWRFHRWSGNPTMAWQGGSNDIHGDATEFAIDDGEWHHFVGTSNGVSNVRALYIDGREAVSTTLSGPLNSDPNLPLMIGENPGARNRQWNGGIDDVAIWRRALTAEQIEAIYLAGTNGQSLGDLISDAGIDPLGLAVSLAADDPLTIRAEFNTQPARQYDILVSPDLNSPRDAWTELEGYQDIPADESGRAGVEFAAPFDGVGFVAVREEGLPAFFEEDFETGDGGWTAVVNDASANTQWELGAPSGTTGPLSGAGQSLNAWSTNLGDYGTDSDVSLFSPSLDFSGIPGAELTFDAFRDADGSGDTATIRFIRVGDDSLLGSEIPIDMGIFDTDYVNLTVPVPAEAMGENARIEFNFVSDGTLDAFSGLSIDNVTIEVATP